MKKVFVVILALVIVGSGFVYYSFDGNKQEAVQTLKRGPQLALKQIGKLNKYLKPSQKNLSLKSSKLLILRTADQVEDLYTYSSSQVLIVNNVPYFIDCGDAWLGQIVNSIQGSNQLRNVFKPDNFRIMFITQLDKSATIELPAFITQLDGHPVDKKIYGPQGIGLMVAHINSAWKVNRNNRFQGFIHQQPEGVSVEGIDIDPDIYGGAPIFEDENVSVEAFPINQGHKAFDYRYAYRFTTKPDGEVIIFAGHGPYREELAQAAQNADLVVLEDFPENYDDLKEKANFKQVVVVQKIDSKNTAHIHVAKEGELY